MVRNVKSEVAEIRDDGSEVYVPEEMFHLLPEKVEQEYRAVAEKGRAILETVSKELERASKISRSMAHLVSLRHVQGRLWSTEYKATMESILELDMLTTAFVVTYVRLHQGGGGISFNRSELPERLRPKHDEIIDLRNKRFAHDDTDHGSITNLTEVRSTETGFEIHSSLSMRYQFGGSSEWKDLIEAIENIYIDKSEKLIARLCDKTGVEWTVAQRPD